MAIEQQIILSAATGKAVTNVNELKASIAELKNKVGENTIGTEAYQKALAALQQQQNALRGAMYGTKASMEDITAAAQGLGDSYNAIVHKMAELKNEFRSTSDEARRMELGQQINSLNNRLKEMDALQGNFQRNVGNYGNALGQAFTQAGQIFGGPFAKGVQTANGALKLLSTNPIMAVITIAVPLLQKIIDGIKGSEENANAMNGALSALAPVGDAITKILQAMGGAIAWLVGGFSNLTQAIFGTTDAMKERQAIAQAEIELAKQTRENIIANAEAARDSEKYRALAAEKDKITSEERIALLEKSAALEREIAKRNYDAAKLAYEIKKRTNALTDSSTEELREEAELYAKMLESERAYYARIKETASQISETRNKLHAEELARAKEVLAAQRARLEAERDLITQTLEVTEAASREHLRLTIERLDVEQRLEEENAKAKITDEEALDNTLANIEAKYIGKRLKAQRDYEKTLEGIRVQGLKKAAALIEKGTLENLKALAAVRIEELKNVQREEGETEESYNARKIAAEQAVQASIRAIRKKEADLSTEELALSYERSNKTAADAAAYELALAENKLRVIQELGREEGETEVAYLTRIAQAQAAVASATNALLDEETERTRLALENRMNAEEEGSIAYLSKAVELKKYELDTLHRIEGESNEEFHARQLEAQKAYNNARADLAKQGVAIFQSSVGAMSALLGSLADMYESDTEATQEELKAAKNMKIAGATIDMLSGVVTAISTAQQLGPIAGPIMAAINSAAVIAAGIANINKIKQQATDKNASSSVTPTAPAAVSAPQISNQVQQYRAITTASEEERLDQMAGDRRVVLVMSDLEVAENDIRVQVEESSF
jgi:hypothetical protein